MVLGMGKSRLGTMVFVHLLIVKKYLCRKYFVEELKEKSFFKYLLTKMFTKFLRVGSPGTKYLKFLFGQLTSLEILKKSCLPNIFELSPIPETSKMTHKIRARNSRNTEKVCTLNIHVIVALSLGSHK
jgi:hypothetical protein